MRHVESTLRAEMRADLAETRADLTNAMRVQTLSVIAANAALVTLAVGARGSPGCSERTRGSATHHREVRVGITRRAGCRLPPPETVSAPA